LYKKKCLSLTTKLFFVERWVECEEFVEQEACGGGQAILASHHQFYVLHVTIDFIDDFFQRRQATAREDRQTHKQKAFE